MPLRSLCTLIYVCVLHLYHHHYCCCCYLFDAMLFFNTQHQSSQRAAKCKSHFNAISNFHFCELFGIFFYITRVISFINQILYYAEMKNDCTNENVFFLLFLSNTYNVVCHTTTILVVFNKCYKSLFFHQTHISSYTRLTNKNKRKKKTKCVENEKWFMQS